MFFIGADYPAISARPISWVPERFQRVNHLGLGLVIRSRRRRTAQTRPLEGAPREIRILAQPTVCTLALIVGLLRGGRVLPAIMRVRAMQTRKTTNSVGVAPVRASGAFGRRTNLVRTLTGNPLGLYRRTAGSSGASPQAELQAASSDLERGVRIGRIVAAAADRCTTWRRGGATCCFDKKSPLSLLATKQAAERSGTCQRASRWLAGQLKIKNLKRR